MDITRNKDATCSNCPFWKKVGMIGECRLNPPEVNSHGESGWPSVPPTGWCSWQPSLPVFPEDEEKEHWQ